MYKRTVLIVDDQEINRKILGNMLKDVYDILYAGNGWEAMHCLKSNAESISVVLLDIIMPEMDGYQVLSEMRADLTLSMIPVIVSSQKEGDQDEIRALAMGAQDYIAKPYNPEIIRHRISNLIRLRENSATINRIQKDQLTGLYNKEFFITKTEDTLKENPDRKYDIIYLGVERFKYVNDAYGTKKGNEVLRFIADRMQEALGNDSIIGRFGADNFYVLREHREYTNDMFKPWINRISKCPIEMDLKIHCGIYEIKHPSMEVEGMCDRAKMAADKNRGNYETCFCWYDESLREKLLNEQFILSAMYKALEEGQFQIYYQPKYDLNTEMIAGAEALVRWIHPQKGMLAPGEFVPVFEKNGFITQLDRYVWERVCKDIHNWMKKGLPPAAISVNVSRADIYNPRLPDILLNLVTRYEIPIRYLHLEITETSYTENQEQLISCVQRLREAGFVIEMDDFGSGYSSLNMLAEMPVDVLKLDMRFIQKEAKVTSGRGILNFIISLAKWMGLVVVAEGVETRDQIAMLRSMDCNYVQGFYFAKPMITEEFENILKSADITEMSAIYKTALQYVTESEPIRKLEEGRVMLIVDDTEINRESLAAAFMGEYLIAEAENGIAAWEYLDEHYSEIDVVMLDLLMPEMDGFQLLNKIRSDSRMSWLPVIITSQGNPDNERKALQLHANDYISKPYNVDIIRHRVANVVGNYQLHRIRERLQTSFSSGNEKILNIVEELKIYFDIVRLVDPGRTIVYDDHSCDGRSCFSVWGKTARCNNCTSLKAFENHTKVSKLEYSDEGLFFVVSQYVPHGMYGAVLEIVSKLDDEYVDNVFGKDMLYLNLDEINDQIERDDLTGVFNRRHLDTYLSKYISNAKQKGTDLGVAMVDVDHFKLLNDTRGHIVGDEALKSISKILEDNIALNKGDFVTRFGGDEFIIVCKDISREMFERRLNSAVALVAHITSKDGVQLMLSISCGCTMLGEMPEADGKELLKCADRRLYRAKERGRGCVVAKD